MGYLIRTTHLLTTGVAFHLVSSRRQRYLFVMAAKTSDHSDLTATLAFIFGAIVMVASISSLLLTLLAIARIYLI